MPLTGVALVVHRTLATEPIEAQETLLVRSLTVDPVFDLPPPMRTLAVAVDVMGEYEQAVGVETIEALVLAVRYELVFSAAEEVVDIGRAASPEMDHAETREVGGDAVNVPASSALLVKNGQPRTCSRKRTAAGVGLRGRSETG